MAAADNSEEVQKLKDELLYCVDQLCKEMAEEYQVTVPPQVIATIAQLTYKQIGSFAGDLECFARHGKRSVINVDDVKLLVRKTPELADFIAQKASEFKKRKGREEKTNVPDGDHE